MAVVTCFKQLRWNYLYVSLVRIYMNWISYEISVPVTNVLSTLVRLKVCVFLVIENTSWIDSRPHYRFDELIRKTFENDRIARL